MNKRLYCSPDRKLCGVCGGIADYFNVDPSLVRLIAVEIAFFTAIIPSLLVYFIVALVIPQPPEDYAQHYQNTARRLYRGPEKKLAGVCSGIANYLNMDPTLVRLLFVLLFLIVGNGLYTYIACAIIFPSAEAPQDYAQPPYGQQQYTQPPYEQPYEQPAQEPQAESTQDPSAQA